MKRLALVVGVLVLVVASAAGVISYRYYFAGRASQTGWYLDSVEANGRILHIQVSLPYICNHLRDVAVTESPSAVGIVATMTMPSRSDGCATGPPGLRVPRVVRLSAALDRRMLYGCVPHLTPVGLTC